MPGRQQPTTELSSGLTTTTTSAPLHGVHDDGSGRLDVVLVGVQRPVPAPGSTATS